MNTDIAAYHESLPHERKAICDHLFTQIQQGLPDAESKVWHGSPVWFLDGNPIVGYDSLKDSVRILFWSGQSLDEPGLAPEGSFKAAEARYTDASQIDDAAIARWLGKARDIQWDYKNIVKRKGVLIRIEKTAP